MDKEGQINIEEGNPAALKQNQDESGNANEIISDKVIDRGQDVGEQMANRQNLIENPLVEEIKFNNEPENSIKEGKEVENNQKSNINEDDTKISQNQAQSIQTNTKQTELISHNTNNILSEKNQIEEQSLRPQNSQPHLTTQTQTNPTHNELQHRQKQVNQILSYVQPQQTCLETDTFVKQTGSQFHRPSSPVIVNNLEIETRKLSEQFDFDKTEVAKIDTLKEQEEGQEQFGDFQEIIKPEFARKYTSEQTVRIRQDLIKGGERIYYQKKQAQLQNMLNQLPDYSLLIRSQFES